MFHSARIRLTVWYLLILMIISGAFSLAIYRVLTIEIDRFSRIQRFHIEQRTDPTDDSSSFIVIPQNRPPTVIIDSALLAETKQRIIILLGVTDFSILILSGGLAYILAGRTLAPIQKMVIEQNRFISDASHELRTPLTSLKTAFEVYLRSQKPSPKESKSLIRESISEVDKLQSLSESLLALAQYQKPNDKTAFAPVFIDKIIDDAVRRIKPLADKNDITIKKTGNPQKIKAEKYALTDLFVILLDNAVKYSPSKKTIEISWKKTDSYLDVSVKDEGIGIESKDIPHLFDRFYRADSARTHIESGGYGLGLSIAQKIIDLHHGAIHVESNPKKGSIFTVHLPTHNSHLQKPAIFS